MVDNKYTQPEILFSPFPDRYSTPSKTSEESNEVEILKSIILNISINYDREGRVEALINELRQSNSHLEKLHQCQHRSILHQYILESTRTPIDLSKQEKRTSYRPNLIIRTNDAHGVWIHNHLLTLLSLEYSCDTEFPPLWKTDEETKVQIRTIKNYQQEKNNQSSMSKITNEEEQKLPGFLKAICRQYQRSEDLAEDWEKKLNGENIDTVENLRHAVANERIWNEIKSITLIGKEMIKNYVQLNDPSLNQKQSKIDYDTSDATLYADIHRIRRYFHHITNTLQFTSYLKKEAVVSAIIETRKTYADDGNVLNTIESYLQTFCLENRPIDREGHEKKLLEWKKEKKELEEENERLQEELKKYEADVQQAESKVRLERIAMNNIERDCRRIIDEVEKSIKETATLDRSKSLRDWTDQRERAKKKKFKAESDLKKGKDRLEEVEAQFALKIEPIRKIQCTIIENEAKIEDLNSSINIDGEDVQKKLTVKYGRGLLLYGPPGTGKSELLKRVAQYAGITMITTPLSAGELNRPYVGETERLLVDIMNRSNTIPYLICAMTIDEIDGLVPKRTNNAQQSKVDGISVLLSHIEGVKNIQNLIVLGATNRRNMMDEAFLRRMQAKCFVGRPSPTIRKKLLEPLHYLNADIFNNKMLNFLMKITTNFSGAAVVALKSSIIVAMSSHKTVPIDERIFLELANNAAREFSCWFGIGTLPEICRLYPNIFSLENNQQEKYSLKIPNGSPTGRISVDLETRKCLIELENEATLEEDLSKEENSTNTLLSRFLNGCASRNIDTIQIIDLNFLVKNNAFEENQIFEFLTTIFEECDEYNRSMLIFDIDSLIMIGVSDSAMSKSQSISNIRLYQFIREKCKKAVVEQQGDVKFLKERWIVMIVKEIFLRDLLFKDINFKKTLRQKQEEYEEEQKRLDDEIPKTCPKCDQSYIPSQVNHGSCKYHDGYIVHIDRPKETVKQDEAERIIKRIRLANADCSHDSNHSKVPVPKLIWTCCLTFFAENQPCKTGICGLPDQLKDKTFGKDEDLTMKVKEFFENNQVAKKNIDDFIASLNSTSEVKQTRKTTITRPK
ncbi:unnamed protein product [Adineta ricciae]|uniref:AAA+ ATPase domain-containing protein n=1 Tax=Adineta ricciae TaxID=249248 RepID=A0A814JVI4_ADIRI|nr:unnamed protein product [Adineta ricciae]CAF1156097.1 unnamed protein product [Adineta ricciae]